MKREKQLMKNTVIVAIGKISTQFISFFMLPLYTSLLSSKEYGTVDLLNTYISLFLPLLFFQIDQGAFRFLIDVRKDEKETNEYISTILRTIITQSILYLLIYVGISIFISNEYKYFLAINVIATIFSTTLLQISRGMGNNKTYSIGSFISGICTVVLNILFIACFKWGAYGMLMATGVSNIICSIYVILNNKIHKRFVWKNYSKEKRRKIWKYSLPLIPNQLSWWIINVSDRSIITWFIGIAANGVYSAANKFSSICITFFNIFNMTWAESASLSIDDKDKSEFFSKIINITLKIFISLIFGIIAIMPFVFKFLIVGAEYSSAYYQIPILMVSTIFNVIVSLLGSIYIAIKKSNEIAKTSIYSAIINIFINLLCISKIGLYAASISTLIAYLSMSIYRYVDVQKYVKVKVNKKLILFSILIGSAIIICYYSKNWMFCLLGMTIAIVYGIINVWNIALKCIGMIKQKLLKFKVN